MALQPPQWAWVLPPARTVAATWEQCVPVQVAPPPCPVHVLLDASRTRQQPPGDGRNISSILCSSEHWLISERSGTILKWRERRIATRPNASIWPRHSPCMSHQPNSANSTMCGCEQRVSSAAMHRSTAMHRSPAMHFRKRRSWRPDGFGPRGLQRTRPRTNCRPPASMGPANSVQSLSRHSAHTREVEAGAHQCG